MPLTERFVQKIILSGKRFFDIFNFFSFSRPSKHTLTSSYCFIKKHTHPVAFRIFPLTDMGCFRVFPEQEQSRRGLAGTAIPACGIDIEYLRLLHRKSRDDILPVKIFHEKLSFFQSLFHQDNFHKFQAAGRKRAFHLYGE